MTLPILVEADNGNYAASLVGKGNVRAVAATPEEALSALRTELRVAQGQLASIDVSTQVGVSHLAGIFAADPTLPEIGREAFEQRDSDVRE